MAIYRSKPTEEFLVLKNEVAQDGSISMQASGLLHYMLSLPVDWHFNLEHLNKHFKVDGKQKIRSGLKELEEAHYLVRKQVRKQGRFAGQDWLVFDKPVKLPPSENPNTPPSKSGGSKSDISKSGKPKSSNSTLQKTEGTKDRGNKDISNKRQNEQTNSNFLNKEEDTNNNNESNETNDRSFDSEDIHKALSFYQKNVGTISPFQAEQLQAYSNDFSSDMIIEAIKVALNKNIRSIKFIKGVLNTWHKKNVHTLEEKKADDLEHKKQYSNNINDSKDTTNGGIIEHENGDIEF